MGNISRESCKSSKQASANAQVCLYDLQVSREIFAIFQTKDTVIYILHFLNWLLLAFLTSENDVIYTVTCPNFGASWCVIAFKRSYFLV